MTAKLDLIPEGINQHRKLGMFLRSSDLNTIDEVHPHLGMKSNPGGTRVHRCVQEFKGKGNKYAICQASTGQSYKTGKKL